MPTMRPLDPDNPRFLQGIEPHKPDPATATDEEKAQYAYDIAADFLELLEYNLRQGDNNGECKTHQETTQEV